MVDLIAYFQSIADTHKLGIKIVAVNNYRACFAGGEAYDISAIRQSPRAHEQWEGYWAGNTAVNSLSKGWGTDIIYNEDGSVTSVHRSLR